MTARQDFVLPVDLTNATAIVLSYSDRDWKPYGGTFGVKGVRVMLSIYDASPSSPTRKNLLGYAHVDCKSRSKGDFEVTISSLKETKLASFGRDKSGQNEVAVLSATGQPIATILDSSRVELACDDSVALKAGTPLCQPQCKHICCAFLLFLPTLGIGAWYCNRKAERAGWDVSVTNRNGEALPDMVLTAKGTDGSWNTMVKMDGLSSGKEKFALMTLALFKIADGIAAPANTGGTGATA